MDEPSVYRISVKGIVINDDGLVLLCREDNGKWEMMGGGIDHGETPEECMHRDIKEETSLEVTYMSPAPLYFFTYERRLPGKFAANIVYEIKLKDLNFTPSEECQELKFFSVDEMKKLDRFPNIDKLIEALEKYQILTEG